MTAKPPRAPKSTAEPSLEPAPTAPNLPLAPTLWAGAVATVVIWLAVQIGWWWITPLVGLAIGLVPALARRALAIATVAGALGWGLPLALLAFSAPVGRLASAVEGIVGLPATGGALVVGATLLVGALLSVTSAWVSLTGTRLVPDYEARARAVYEDARARLKRLVAR